MRVLMLRNPKADLGCKLHEGDVGNVSDELGAELIKMGIAEEFHGKEVKGVAKAPEISKASDPPKKDALDTL